MADDTKDAPRPGVDAVHAWAGHRLDEIGGGSVGRVEGFYVDESSGEPEWLLARMGRFGHYTLVPGRDAVEGVGRVWVPYTRELIRRAPRIEPGAALTVASERELLGHYGIAVEAGRAPELAARDADAVSARPAETG
jgi:hypothetical protein